MTTQNKDTRQTNAIRQGEVDEHFSTGGKDFGKLKRGLKALGVLLAIQALYETSQNCKNCSPAEAIAEVERWKNGQPGSTEFSMKQDIMNYAQCIMQANPALAGTAAMTILYSDLGIKK